MKLKNKKTGEVVELKLVQVNDKYLIEHEVDSIDGEKLTLKSLADSFDDVKEPLIKDEKIRKAVRAWAEANEISQAQFDRYTSGFSASDDGHNLLSMISFDGFVFMFVDGKYYTIDELCGEEKECES